MGWSTNDEPLLLFKNLIAKPRKERSKKETVDLQQTPQLQVGNDIVNIEAVRFQLKTQFDRNVVTHFEAQENVFDYIFTHLGVDVEDCVPHPILITEAVLNPYSSRQCMLICFTFVLGSNLEKVGPQTFFLKKLIDFQTKFKDNLI